MSPIEIIALLALVGFAIYRQTRQSEVLGGSRFTLAVIYAIAGILIGGFALPHSAAEVLVLGTGIALSVVVGLARGRLTRLWAQDGRVYSKGTPLTIGLFLAWSPPSSPSAPPATSCTSATTADSARCW